MSYPPSFTVSEDGKAITCLVCGMTSHNPHDVANRYCGNCRVFHEQFGIVPPEMRPGLVESQRLKFRSLGRATSHTKAH